VKKIKKKEVQPIAPEMAQEVFDRAQRVRNAKFAEIPIDNIDANPWNPYHMTAEVFNDLVENISDAGMNQAILIVPVEDDKGRETGRFRIIDGEQRLLALRLAGAERVPCMIVSNMDEDEQKFQTLKMNRLRGEIDKKKFSKLVEGLLQKGYTVPELERRMAFHDPGEFKALVDSISEGLPPKVKKEFDAVKQEIKDITDLTKVLNKLFAQYGSDLPYSYMIVDFGGKTHYWIRMQGKDDLKIFKKRFDLAKKLGVTVDSVVMALLRRGFTEKFIEAVRDELQAPDYTFVEDALNTDFLSAIEGMLEEPEL
jgi:hypothetical protein